MRDRKRCGAYSRMLGHAPVLALWPGWPRLQHRPADSGDSLNLLLHQHANTTVVQNKGRDSCKVQAKFEPLAYEQLSLLLHLLLLLVTLLVLLP